MKFIFKTLTIALLLASSGVAAHAEKSTDLASTLPRSIYSGLQGKHHVQGIAVDPIKGYAYFSFTTRFVKTRLDGTLVGTIDGLDGHLGCLSFNKADGKVYGSMEYKNDEIGTGISGDRAKSRASHFCIAAIDVDRIDRPGMSPAEVVNEIDIPEVADDYAAHVTNRGRDVEHRYGCSGIDGIAFAPQPGKRGSRDVLYIAYGIYGDSTRTDNDYQVLLAYDINKRRLLDRYFVYTGNTSWGIQNLCYDPANDVLFAAVYRGIKPQYPNYTLFAIDLGAKAKKEQLRGFDSGEKGKVLPLKKWGLHHAATDTYGWNFPLGSTGLTSLGGGLFYISHNSTRPEQNTTLHLYRYTPDAPVPFTKIEQ